MKYPFGTIKDSRRKDMFSLIIFGFPIFSWFRINFRSDLNKEFFKGMDENYSTHFLFILGFHINTWIGK